MKIAKVKIHLLFGLTLLVLFSSSCSADQQTLKSAYADKFLIGCALNDDQVKNKYPSEIGIVTRHFNTITPENILKWEAVHPKPFEYDFVPADRLVTFGQKHNMFIVGHTLVWHNQTPGWIFKDSNGETASKELLLERMQKHISTVVDRYKGKIQGWDVVNEAVEDNGNMRNNKWFQIAGEDYVIFAFKYAHQADPSAELYYNDYNMWKPAHRDGVIRLIKKLQSEGIRIDGIGMQGHWGLDYPPLDEVEAAIVAYAALGVKVMITEMDITVLPNAGNYTGADITKNYELRKELNPYPDGLPGAMQKTLAQRYAEIFSLFSRHADKISRVTFWGIQDGNSWRNYWPIKGRTDYPLLFDRNCKPKPALDAVIKATVYSGQE